MLRAWLTPLFLLLAAGGCATSNSVDDGDDDGQSGGSTTGSGGGGTCADPPTAAASNSGPVCGGDPLTLTAQAVAGATYAWTGPNGFTSSEESPTLSDFGPEDEGTYSLVVTVDGCASAPATTVVTGPAEAVAFSQTTTADFDMNTNASLLTANDEITLGSQVDTGDGSDGAFAPGSSTTIAGGTYDFTTVTIPSGVTVTVTGNQPLVIRATGAVAVNGTIDASGAAGGNGVTYSTFGAGGLGRAGGGNGGNGSFDVNLGPLAGVIGTGTGPGAAGSGWSGGGGGGHVALGGSSGGAGGSGGISYGMLDLTTLTAGSGGGGGSGGYNCGAGGGGGGGGAIWISAPSITVGGSGAVRANGGPGGSDGSGSCGGGGGGSGGSIRLTTSTLSNSGTISAQGGVGGASVIAGSPYYGIGGVGSAGRIRLDYGTKSGAGTVSPAAGFEGSVVATTGTTLTDLIAAPSGFCSWGTLTFEATEPSGTSVVVDVLDQADEVVASGVQSGTDLGTILDGVTAVRLRATLATTGSEKPVLGGWSLGYMGL